MSQDPKCPRCAATDTRRVRNYGRPVGNEWMCLDCGRRWEEPDVESLNSARFTFMSNFWNSWIDGMHLHEWLDKKELELGGLSAAVDAAMARAGKEIH